MNLLIIDDHPMTCAGLQGLLKACYPDAVIQARHQGRDALDSACAADYIFLDMHLPDLGFMEMLDRLSPWMSKVILISAAPEPSAVATARQRGVRGLLLKNADVQHVLEGFNRIRLGERVFDAMDTTSGGEAPALTGRQHDVLDALLGGLSNKQIARELGISEHTVKEHVTAILAIFGVRNRLELVLARQLRN